MGAGSILTAALALYAVSTLISMAVMNIAAFILAVATGYYFFRQRERFVPALRWVSGTPSGRAYLRASVLLALALILSLLAALLFPAMYGGKPLLISFFRDIAKLWYLFWPFIVCIALGRLDDGQRRKVLTFWLGAFAVLSAIGIAQYFTGWPRPQPIPENEPYFHTTLFLGHHLSVASVFIFPFFAALDLATRQAALRRWLVPAIVLGLLALIGTWSRMVWVALPAGLLAWALLVLPRRWRIGAIVALVVAAGLATQHPKINSRLHFLGGIGERETLWKVNLEFFRARPLTGTGWRHNEEASAYVLTERSGGKSVFAGHAHNNLLDLLGGAGLLGLLAWLYWWWVVIRIAFKTRRDPAREWVFAAGILCAFVAFHLNGLTQVNFWEAKVQHQLGWVIAWLLLWNAGSRNAESGR